MASNESKKPGCPKCLGLLEAKEIGEMQGSPIRIDQCPVCSGIWFDEGELDEVLRREITFDDEKSEEAFRKDWTGDMLDLKKARCPRCQKDMDRVMAPKDSRVVMDYCVSCGGSWLDGGEIRLLMRGGAVHRGLKLVFGKISAPFKKIRDERQMRGR